MKNLNDDTKFESYLRAFQPIAPTPIPVLRKQPLLLWAAAFATAVALAVLLIRADRHIRPVPEAQLYTQQGRPIAEAIHRPITLRDLDAAARQGDQALESALDASDSAALPRVDRPNTALNTLSGE